MREVATRDDRSPAQILTAQVRSDEFKEQVAMALPENMPPSRFVRATVTALLQNPALADVDRDSLFASMLKCAADGLLPDGREAALVPYKGKAQYLPMIGGYRKIAGEHGWTIETVVVHAKDVFSYSLGLDPRVDHTPAAINTDRGDLVAAYAIGRHRDGRRVVEVYDAAAVAAAKGVAQTDRVWKQWPAQMWEKTVGKRLFAKLPLDPADKRVAGLMVDAQEIGPAGSTALLYGPGGQTFTAREITQHSSGKGAESHAAEEGPRSPTPPAGGPDDQDPALAAPSPDPAPTGGQQVAGEPSSQGESPAPPAVPGPTSWTEWSRTLKEPAFPIPDAVIDAAGSVEVQPGWTVAAVCSDAKGREWAVWALGADYDGTIDAKIVDALRLYVGQRHPELTGVQS